MYNLMELVKIINEGKGVIIAPQVIYSKEMSLHLCKHIAKRMLTKDLYIMLQSENILNLTIRKQLNPL